MDKEKRGARNCMTCRFRDEIREPPPGIGRINICRRMPPVPIVVQSAHGLAATSSFPAISDGTWCYEWTADLASLTVKGQG